MRFLFLVLLLACSSDQLTQPKPLAKKPTVAAVIVANGEISELLTITRVDTTADGDYIVYAAHGGVQLP